jgi:hypothetical protein
VSSIISGGLSLLIALNKWTGKRLRTQDSISRLVGSAVAGERSSPCGCPGTVETVAHGGDPSRNAPLVKCCVACFRLQNAVKPPRMTLGEIAVRSGGRHEARRRLVWCMAARVVLTQQWGMESGGDVTVRHWRRSRGDRPWD